jgi:hypothetical protein
VPDPVVIAEQLKRTAGLADTSHGGVPARRASPGAPPASAEARTLGAPGGDSPRIVTDRRSCRAGSDARPPRKSSRMRGSRAVRVRAHIGTPTHQRGGTQIIPYRRGADRGLSEQTAAQIRRISRPRLVGRDDHPMWPALTSAGRRDRRLCPLPTCRWTMRRPQNVHFWSTLSACCAHIAA